MSLYQAIAWIEEKEARILHVNNGLQNVSTIVAPASQDIPKQHASNDGTVEETNGFFRQIARALDTADEILVVGPSAIKLEFVKYMHKNDHAFDPRILGVETVDSPTDHQLDGYAKLYFTEGSPRRTGNGSGFKEAE
jgi:stalled ribosome rescue protein Dom34